jgi:NAD(P)-dependent dehydrogenase (short-subunit alcohol dehydrogenase family)
MPAAWRTRWWSGNGASPTTGSRPARSSRSTKQLLESRGESVIGIDIRDADVLVDLTSPIDRERMVEEVSARSGGRVDAIVAVAGLAAPIPATAAVNYFGMVATLQGLRPLLAGSDPRAHWVSRPSPALLRATKHSSPPFGLRMSPQRLRAQPTWPPTPRQRNADLPVEQSRLCAVGSRTSITDEWAGAGIPLNAIAPVQAGALRGRRQRRIRSG